MPGMISYSVGYSAIDAAGTSVTVARPPAYQAGDLLVMGVIGGGTTGAVTPSAPSGWTAVSGGSIPGAYVKTATGSEPASYTVSLSGTSTAAAFVAAYPAATVAGGSYHSSGADVTTYAPAFPSGVTTGQTVLLIAAAVASVSDPNGNSGYQNIVLPQSGWTTEVPAFGPALPDNASSVLPVAIGLADVKGSTSSPTLTSPQGCEIYACYLVLNVTGTAAPLSVTATAAYPEAVPGLALTVKALTGAAGPAAIAAGGATKQFYAGGTSLPPQATVTPNESGSVVYGAVTENFGVSGAASFTPASGTTFSQNIASTSLSEFILGTFRGAGTTTSGTPVTLGGSAPSNSFFTAALAEILAAGTIAETATATAAGTLPGHFATTAIAQTAIFRNAPAGGSLLVAMVSANSNYGANPGGNNNATVTLSDSSGLTWVPLAQVPYPSYSGVWVAEVPAAGVAPFTVPGTASRGRRAARRGTAAGSAGAPYVYVPPAPPSPFAQPHRVADRHPAARKGRTAGSPGAKYVFVALTPSPFTVPGRALPAHPAARRGTSAGSPGAPYAAVSPWPQGTVLDEGGGPVLDEGGGYVLDESGPSPEPGSTSWTAARAGMPGDTRAVNFPDQAAQFLYSHPVTPVYAGNRTWTTAVPSPTVTGAFAWLAQGTPGWLPAYSVSQPFTMPAGVTQVGRVQVPVLASGSGAGLQVTLCPDNGSGSPNLAAVLASAAIPASHVLATSAAGSLASAGPLALARYNTSLLGAYLSGPWTQPATSALGPGSYATPVTSGGYTVLVGGYNIGSGIPTAVVSVIAYQGSTVSGGVTQPSLPQAAWYTCAAITSDSVAVAGGIGTGAGFTTVWTAPWAPGTGSVGAWSAQQALPVAVVAGAMAAWGTQLYVIGGSTDGTAAHATAAVWTAPSQSGQVTAWTAGPPLPQALVQPYAAVVGNWLVVTGGQDTAGTAQSATWYSAISSDGSLAGWQQGPALPQVAYAFAPNWNLAVTDSAVIIVSGGTTGAGGSPYTQVLSVSPDGPADAWQLQNWGGSAYGEFQAAAYPSGPGGQWQVFCLRPASFDVAALGPVPLVSVPLPASGLTPGATYHVVMQQPGGSPVNSLQLGAVAAPAGSHWLSSPAGSPGTWTAQPGQQVAVNVLDRTPGGPVLHLVEDSGARVTSPVWSGASGLLAGVMESVVFPSGSPEAVLGTVTEVTWNGGLPSGLVTLA